MGKILVIRGADFSENKLGTVVFDETIPCTEITLNTSTLSLTEWSETSQLVATTIPNDTTDQKIWSSSNENVATVSSNGVVTSKGIGTATITVTCGSYSATCTVTSTVTFSGSDLMRKNDYGLVVNSGDSAKFLGGSYYALIAYGMATGLLSEYELAINSAETIVDPMYGIPIPANASQLKITLPDTSGTNLQLCDISYHNSETLQTAVSNVTACKYISHTTYQSSSFGDSGTTLTINLTTSKPSGADSICLYVRAASTTASVITDPITLEFS